MANYSSVCEKCAGCELYIKAKCLGLLDYFKFDCKKWRMRKIDHQRTLTIQNT